MEKKRKKSGKSVSSKVKQHKVYEKYASPEDGLLEEREYLIDNSDRGKTQIKNSASERPLTKDRLEKAPLVSEISRDEKRNSETDFQEEEIEKLTNR